MTNTLHAKYLLKITARIGFAELPSVGYKSARAGYKSARAGGFGLRLAMLRKERKISQTELAKKVGIHPNVLGRYEREEATPSIDIATRLADALNVSLDYLVGKIDIELEKNLVEKIITIQKLPQEDKYCLMYSIDGLIQHAINRQAYAQK